MTDRSLYGQWYSNKIDFTLSKQNEFQQKLFNGQIKEFDLTQDCNIACEYIRCFYRTDDNVIYQETPLIKPFIRWMKQPLSGGLIARGYKREDHAVWKFIHDNYDRECSDYQVRYTRKIVTQTDPSLEPIHHALCTPPQRTLLPEIIQRINQSADAKWLRSRLRPSWIRWIEGELLLHHLPPKNNLRFAPKYVLRFAPKYDEPRIRY